MPEKILEIFSKNPLIWLHYVLLVAALFGGYYLGNAIFINFQALWLMAIWFYFVISISDQIIHKILGVD